jgi:hypothetical protein
MGFLKFSTKRKLLPSASIGRFGKGLKHEFHSVRDAAGVFKEKRELARLQGGSIYAFGSQERQKELRKSIEERQVRLKKRPLKESNKPYKVETRTKYYKEKQGLW